jgi:N-acetylmuramoyl-L-alanine amidase-like protein
MRKAPAVLLLGLAVPALSALPVLSPPAPTPKPVAPEVRAAAVAGVDEAALRSTAGRQSKQASAAARTALWDASRRGRSPDRPAVFTGARHTKSFELLGATWRPGGPADLTVLVRTHGEHGWTGWTPLDEADQAPADEAQGAGDGKAERIGTEPLWTGPSDGYQVRVDLRSGSLPQDLRVDLIDPGDSRADSTVGQGAPAASAAAAVSQPRIYSRAEWGADERLRSGSPTYMSTIKAGFVHHTAGTNGYAAADVPKILRGIYAYHTKSSGWSDIGYNFLVDRFGRIWEGRYGGITKAVKGAHAGGFNNYSFGVSAIGNYDTVAAPPAMVDAIARVMAWKLSLFYRDPLGSTTLVSEGGGTSKYAAGRSVALRTINAHRDVGYTACPGRYLFGYMNTVRSKAASYLGQGLVSPSVTVGTTAATVKSGVLHSDQTWRVRLKEAVSGQVIRQTSGSGTISTSVALTDTKGAPLASGRYVVSVESWRGTATAVPYTKAFSRGGNATDAVHAGDGMLVVASRRSDGGIVVQKAGSTGLLGTAVDLGRTIVGKPVIARTAAGTLVVGVRGIDNQLSLRRSTAQGGWTPWESTGIRVSGAAAMVPSGSNGVMVLYPGTDGALWSRTNATPGSWSAASRLGGRIVPGSGVGATRTADGRVHVAVQGMDHAGWYVAQSGAAWGPWVTLGGRLQGDVDLASPDGAAVVTAAWGVGAGEAWFTTIRSGKPGSWARAIAGTNVTSPVVAEPGGSTGLTLVTRYTDQRLYESDYVSGAWRNTSAIS